ncbi:MAG: transglutaminase N-terminal domain-containing protein [Opitutales bacterium]
MATYEIQHRTHYIYDAPVAVSHHSAHLQPRTDARQQCHRFALTVRPAAEDVVERQDYFGNTVQYFSIQESHQELIVDSQSEVTVQPMLSLLPDLSPTCREVRAAVLDRTTEEALHALQFCYGSPSVPLAEAIEEFAAPFFADERPFLQAALELAHHLHGTFKFDPKATDVTTPVEAFLELRRGVCQDFAHLMLACLRSQCLPGAYVSGYILTQPPPGSPRLVGADASHAWVSIYLPGQGWVDLDPTNDLVCGEQHVAVARGRDYTDVSLVRGAVTGGGHHTIAISVTMTPEGERVGTPPRP